MSEKELIAFVKAKFRKHRKLFLSLSNERHIDLIEDELQLYVSWSDYIHLSLIDKHRTHFKLWVAGGNVGIELLNRIDVEWNVQKVFELLEKFINEQKNNL